MHKRHYRLQHMVERFPKRQYQSIGEFFDGYAANLAEAAASVDRSKLAAAEALLNQALERDAQIFACGNGGSAAISGHLACDCAKGTRVDTALRPRVVSLSSNVEIITAIANDIAFADIFAQQLSAIGRRGDVLIAISSSGNSENIVRALAWARKNGLDTIAMTGFDGGRAAALADVVLHVPAQNYGVIEDMHQSMMHVLAQFVRQVRMPSALVPERKF